MSDNIYKPKVRDMSKFEISEEKLRKREEELNKLNLE
jgi:hypothetical protein